MKPPFERSFANHKKCKFWDHMKNNLLPAEVFKGSQQNFWFNCPQCNHSFKNRWVRLRRETNFARIVRRVQDYFVVAIGATCVLLGIIRKYICGILRKTKYIQTKSLNKAILHIILIVNAVSILFKPPHISALMVIYHAHTVIIYDFVEIRNVKYVLIKVWQALRLESIVFQRNHGMYLRIVANYTD